MNGSQRIAYGQQILILAVATRQIVGHGRIQACQILLRQVDRLNFLPLLALFLRLAASSQVVAARGHMLPVSSRYHCISWWFLHSTSLAVLLNGQFVHQLEVRRRISEHLHRDGIIVRGVLLLSLGVNRLAYTNRARHIWLRADDKGTRLMIRLHCLLELLFERARTILDVGDQSWLTAA